MELLISVGCLKIISKNYLKILLYIENILSVRNLYYSNGFGSDFL